MDKLVVTSRVKSISTTHAVNKISELHLRGAADVSASDLQLMLTNCRKLTKLAVGIPSRLHELKFDAIRQPLPLLTLYLDGNYQIENATVVSLVDRCPHLQALHANDCAKLTPDVVCAAAKNCPELQEIYFNWGQRIYDTKKLSYDLLTETADDPDSCYCELFRSCTKLKVVDLFRRSYGRGNIVTPVDVLTLAQHCTHLTHVKLSSTRSLCRQRDTTDLLDSALVQLVQCNPHIECLILQGFNILTNVALDAIADNLTELQTFILDCCGSGCSDRREGYRRIRNSCRKLTTFEVDHLPSLVSGPPGVLQTLRLHRIDSYGKLNDEMLVRVAQHNYEARLFQYRHCGDGVVTNTGLCVALSHWHNLRTFIVIGDYGFDFSRPANLANVVSKAPVVDDSVLYAVIQNCPFLTTLDISGNTHLSNEAIGTVAKLVHLKHFTANMCKLMEDSALVAIALGCRDLIYFAVDDCQISDAGIRSLALYGSHKLRHISINSCRQLHNSSIQELIRASRKLQFLSLVFNKHITFEAVSELPLYCPYMEQLCIGWMRRSLNWAYGKHKHYFDAILPNRKFLV